MKMISAVNASIRAAGSRITDQDKAAVEVVRRLARIIDHDDFPVIGGKYDNVSIPTLFRYLDALGLTPAGRKTASKVGGVGDGDGKPAGGVAGRRAAARKLRSVG